MQTDAEGRVCPRKDLDDIDVRKTATLQLLRLYINNTRIFFLGENRSENHPGGCVVFDLISHVLVIVILYTYGMGLVTREQVLERSQLIAWNTCLAL